MGPRAFLLAALIAGLVPAAFAQLSNTDKTFVLTAAETNNYQIKAALLATKNSGNPLYRQYALTIANDQTEEAGELESTVADQNPPMQLPSGLSPVEQQRLNALRKAGSRFDPMFRNQMIATVTATIRLYQSYIGQPDANPDIQKMAQSMLPTFQKYLEDAQALPVG
jgi:putative membrane protein